MDSGRGCRYWWFGRKQTAQPEWGDQGGDGCHGDDNGVGGLGHDLGLQAYDGNDECDFAAGHHANAYPQRGRPSLAQQGQAATNQLGDDGEEGNDHGRPQDGSVER